MDQTKSKLEVSSIRFGQPIVRKLSKKKKDETLSDGTARHSSKVLKRAEDVDKHVTKAMRRLTRALDAGVDDYIERRNRTSSEEKDGGIVHGVENVAQGISKVIAETAPALGDLAGLVNTAPVRKQLRQVASTFSKVPLVN